jgi:hypothetical protein
MRGGLFRHFSKALISGTGDFFSAKFSFGNPEKTTMPAAVAAASFKNFRRLEANRVIQAFFFVKDSEPFYL